MSNQYSVISNQCRPKPLEWDDGPVSSVSNLTPVGSYFILSTGKIVAGEPEDGIWFVDLVKESRLTWKSNEYDSRDKAKAAAENHYRDAWEEMTDCGEKNKLELAVMREGDVLVISLRRRVGRHEAEMMRKQLEEVKKEYGIGVILFAEEVDFAVLRKEEDEDEGS